MKKPKMDAILHPVRMRILMAVSGKQMTAQQLVRTLPDVPQTTLYRHLNYLVEHGLLAAVDERRVRGTMERIYELAPAAEQLLPGQFDGAASEDHVRMFSLFVTSLLGEFAQFVHERDGAGPPPESVAYTKSVLYLSEEECRQFLANAQALMAPLLNRQPAPNRKGYLFAGIIFPAGEDRVAQEITDISPTQAPDHEPLPNR